MQISTGDASYDLIVEIDGDSRGGRPSRDKRGLLTISFINPYCVAVKGWVDDNNAHYFLDFSVMVVEVNKDDFRLATASAPTTSGRDVATAIYGGKHFSSLSARELPDHIADLAVSAVRTYLNKNHV